VSIARERIPDRPPGRSAGRRLVARRPSLLTLGIAAFTLALAAWAVYSLTRPFDYVLYPVDLHVYWDGGAIVRHLRPLYDPTLQYPLYDWPRDNVALKFTYTPFAALCFTIVSLVPWSVLQYLSLPVNVLALLAATWFTAGALGITGRRARAGAALLGAAAGLLTEPVFRTMYLGQINLLLMAAIIWDLSQPDGRRRKGFVTGLAAGIKLTPLIFIPYLLLTRRPRAAATATVGFLCSVGLGFAILPRESAVWWLHGRFLHADRTGFVGWGGNQSLNALVTRLAGSINAATVPWLASVVAVTVAGLLAAAVLHRAGHDMLGLLATALVGLFDSPVTWDHHWVWVVPGLMAAAWYAVRAWRSRRRLRAVGCWTVYAVLALTFFPYQGSLWSNWTTGVGEFNNGLIWAAPNSPVYSYLILGDQPWFSEYNWVGLQRLAGNAYILAGLAALILLVVLAAAAWPGMRARSREQAPDTGTDTDTGLSSQAAIA
jgi:alpha-1,2-mannosyltransferase